MSDDALYCYPNGVLRNRFSITDRGEFDAVERRFVVQRLAEGAPRGQFDLAHLQAIHRHLFQDVFEWAGEVRQVEIAKGGDQFLFRQFIERGMADVHRRLEQADSLRGLGADAFAEKAGEIIGDVNHVHPFRDGNGRTQREYLRHLAVQAGHEFDMRKIDGERWIAASRASHQGDHSLMSGEIRRAIGEVRRGDLPRTRDDFER